MNIIRSREFTPGRAWAAMDIADLDGVSTRLHWTDKPYKWHVDNGGEVFVVLDGEVELRYMEDGSDRRTILSPGDIYFAAIRSGCRNRRG